MNVTRWSHITTILFLILLTLSTFALGAEVGEGAGEEKETMLSLIKKGGPVMFPLGIASVLALALGLEIHLSWQRKSSSYGISGRSGPCLEHGFYGPYRRKVLR